MPVLLPPSLSRKKNKILMWLMLLDRCRSVCLAVRSTLDRSQTHGYACCRTSVINANAFLLQYFLQVEYPPYCIRVQTNEPQNEYPEDEEDESTRITSLQNILPSEVLGRSAAFPIAPTSQPNLDFDDVQLRGLLWYLPPPHRATELREIYYQHAAWMSVHFFDFKRHTQ
jgi:hypothetical protein